MTTQKGFAHAFLIIGLVIALIGALGFVFWQNFMQKDSDDKKILKIENNQSNDDMNPYKGWKTYTSNRDGYTIKYPSDWYLTPETSEDGPYIRSFDPNNSSDGPRDGEYSGYPLGAKYVRVLLDKNENGKKSGSDLSTAEWYSKLGQIDIQDGPTNFLAKEVKDVTINDMRAKSAKSAFTETDEVIFILKDTDLYSIWLYPYGSSSDDEMKLILDSFSYL